MTTDEVFLNFLKSQHEQGKALARQSDILTLEPVHGNPPDRYVAHFAAKGLVQTETGEVAEHIGCAVAIWFPEDYLRRADSLQVLTVLGPQHVFHPNIRCPVICMHIRPGCTLVELTYAIYELWTWHFFGTGDNGVNRSAAAWARHQDPKRFPTERRPLKRRALKFAIELQEKGATPC